MIKSLAEYIGQEKLKTLIRAEISAAQRTGFPMAHTLLKGISGVGKSTLARAIAGELKYRMIEFPSPDGLSFKEVQRLLLGLSTEGYQSDGRPLPGAVTHLLFIDECHRMPCFEVWYEPMTDCHVTVTGAKSWLPYFSLVCATTEPELLPDAFKRRLLEYELQPYTEGELAQIVEGSFPGFDHADEVAKRARGSAGFAIKYAQRVLHFGGPEFFAAAEIDERGLTRTDRAYIEILRNNAGAMALSTIAARLQMSPETVRKTVEPFLVSIGELEITEKGRVLSTPGRGYCAMRVNDTVENFLESQGI